MQVLIIGYGKIGRMKAIHWRSLGLDVFAFDLDPLKTAQMQTDGITPVSQIGQLHDSGNIIVDISTPAGSHVSSLEWALGSLSRLPVLILMEKPVVSSRSELIRLERALEKYPEIQARMFINESYVASSAVLEIVEAINSNGEPVEALEFELSKNRLLDNAEGRFFDHSLGAIGIEVPHIIAVVQMFGFDLAAIAAQEAQLFVEQGNIVNQGFRLEYTDSMTKLLLQSYLGDFRFDHDRLRANYGMTRHLVVKTASKNYEVVFDPIDGVPRYHSRIIITDKQGIVKEKVLADNHLFNHLKACYETIEGGQLNLLAGVTNGMAIARVLLELRRQAAIIPSSSNGKISEIPIAGH